jgi:hypothetical protein
MVKEQVLKILRELLNEAKNNRDLFIKQDDEGVGTSGHGDEDFIGAQREYGKILVLLEAIQRIKKL